MPGFNSIYQEKIAYLKTHVEYFFGTHSIIDNQIYNLPKRYKLWISVNIRLLVPYYL